MKNVKMIALGILTIAASGCGQAPTAQATGNRNVNSIIASGTTEPCLDLETTVLTAYLHDHAYFQPGAAFADVFADSAVTSGAQFYNPYAYSQSIIKSLVDTICVDNCVANELAQVRPGNVGNAELVTFDCKLFKPIP